VQPVFFDIAQPVFYLFSKPVIFAKPIFVSFFVKSVFINFFGAACPCLFFVKLIFPLCLVSLSFFVFLRIVFLIFVTDVFVKLIFFAFSKPVFFAKPILWTFCEACPFLFFCAAFSFWFCEGVLFDIFLRLSSLLFYLNRALIQGRVVMFWSMTGLTCCNSNKSCHALTKCRVITPHSHRVF